MPIPQRKAFGLRAWRAIDAAVATGVKTYDRADLVRLMAIGPNELACDDSAAERRLVLRIARALRGERSRGRAGHWTYDLNRHLALAQAYRAERARLGPGRPK